MLQGLCPVLLRRLPPRPHPPITSYGGCWERRPSWSSRPWLLSVIRSSPPSICGPCYCMYALARTVLCQMSCDIWWNTAIVVSPWWRVLGSLPGAVASWISSLPGTRSLCVSNFLAMKWKPSVSSRSPPNSRSQRLRKSPLRLCGPSLYDSGTTRRVSNVCRPICTAARMDRFHCCHVPGIPGKSTSKGVALGK